MPASPIVTWLVAFLASYAVISGFEYAAHRYLMHRMRLPSWIYRVVPHLKQVFRAHAVLHHTHYYREFDFEPDPVGRDYNLGPTLATSAMLLGGTAPLWLPWVKYSPGFYVLPGMQLGYCWLWNVIHREMHIPRGGWLGRTAVFRFLARHHLMHHRRQATNFNLVFPLMDPLIGTLAKPRLRDIREMLVLGYLVPRSVAGRIRVGRIRATIQERRGVPAV